MLGGAAWFSQPLEAQPEPVVESTFPISACHPTPFRYSPSRLFIEAEKKQSTIQPNL
jgi:hypothetical protein